MDKRHSLTRYTVLLIAAGLAINLVLSRLALYFELPLFLDSIGTILSAVLGGYLPGIIVGFFSNVLGGISDPITIYYAIINIMIACAAALLSDHGWFSKPGKAALSIVLFTLIGGGLGSVLTWLLYGFNFGSGISAPFAIALRDTIGLSEFYAQFLADFTIDLADKTVSVLVCCVFLQLAPTPVLERLSCGRYRRGGKVAGTSRLSLPHSLRGKVVLMISVSALILSSAAIFIGYSLYTSNMTEHYTEIAVSVSDMAAHVLNPDKISEYLSSGVPTEEYLLEEEILSGLRESVPDVEYIYVYQIREDGCHVVFDVDTPELTGAELGEVIPIENDFLQYKATLLAGVRFRR